MPLAATLVDSDPYSLYYLVQNTSAFGVTVTIPNAAGATPDLRTDNVTAASSGPMRAIVRAGQDGIGTVAAGGLANQGQSRDILLSDNTVSVGNDLVPRARIELTPRAGAAAWNVDANIDVNGNPTVVVGCTAVAGEAYVRISARHSYDL